MAKRRSGPAKQQPVEYPICVRHRARRKDVRLRHFFLCTPCADKWKREAFDGSGPLCDGEPIVGLCQLCNTKQEVRLRTWFLCDICDRVARSIGRNHVAEQSILDFWRDQVHPSHPQLLIEQNDLSALRPRRDTDVSGEGPLDFLVRDKRTGEVVFGIENKTGRSSIREMSAFQLDVSDCDSILHHVRSLGVPAYVIHAQVLEVWEPPTEGYRVVGLWWSDIYEPTEQFREVRTRRDEQRGAAYFSKRAFHEIESLPPALNAETGELAIVLRYKREGVPPLYRL